MDYKVANPDAVTNTTTMSSVDPGSVEEDQERAARAEELKNTANQFFKGNPRGADLSTTAMVHVFLDACSLYMLLLSECVLSTPYRPPRLCQQLVW